MILTNLHTLTFVYEVKACKGLEATNMLFFR